MTFKRTSASISTTDRILIRCGDLRMAFLALCMVFWFMSLLFLLHIFADSHYPELAAQARAINTYLGEHTLVLMTGPAIIGLTLLYFHWSRTKLSWTNGLHIDGEPVNVQHYQFKETITGATLIYLETDRRLYIVYPATSQDGKKLPDGKQMAMEDAANQTNLKMLKEKLETSAATLKKFWFFTKEVIISFIIAVLLSIVALS